uniref:Uncharacterized protein n=1 Tax=Arundo donax TaxID=35708 RepID=A0A0A9HM41_ARUDO
MGARRSEPVVGSDAEIR